MPEMISQFGKWATYYMHSSSSGNSLFGSSKNLYRQLFIFAPDLLPMNMPFSLLVKYHGKYTIAVAQEDRRTLQTGYRLKFPDGITKTFYAYEGDDGENSAGGWSEENVGLTELAKEIAPFLDNYLVDERTYEEPYVVTVQDVDYIVQPRLDKDQAFYDVYKDERICVIGLNEEGSWEADSDVDEKLVEQIGYSIMEKEA